MEKQDVGTPYLEVTYRKGEPVAAYLYLERHAGTTSVGTKRVGASLLVDFAANGRPIGIEITAPELVTATEVNSVLRNLGLAEMAPEQLRPLRAA